jgi:hypothetical protein
VTVFAIFGAFLIAHLAVIEAATGIAAASIEIGQFVDGKLHHKRKHHGKAHHQSPRENPVQ